MSTFPREVWLAYAAIAGLAGLPVFYPLASGPAQPPAVAMGIAADFVGTGPIELSRVSGRDLWAVVLVRNDSDRLAYAEIRTTALDRIGRPLSGVATADLQEGQSTAIRIHVAADRLDRRRDDRLPARGLAVMRVWPKDAAHLAPTVKVREVVVPQVQPSLAGTQVTLVALLAGGVVLLAGLLLAIDAAPSSAIQGTPRWTPQSWSTNLAIGGALLTGVLAIGGLPAQGYYGTRASYAALSTFFASLVAMAPAVHGLIRVGSVTGATALRMFALAAAVTVWATVGQLGTAALVLLELGIADVVSDALSTAAAMFFWAVAVLVEIYALRALWAYSTGGGDLVSVKAGGRPVPPPARTNEWPLL